jgi:hypothetical protein
MTNWKAVGKIATAISLVIVCVLFILAVATGDRNSQLLIGAICMFVVSIIYTVFLVIYVRKGNCVRKKVAFYVFRAIFSFLTAILIYAPVIIQRLS